MKINRRFLCFILFFSFSVSLQANDPQISLRGGKLLVNRQVYGYLVKKSAVFAKNYSFLSSRNEELVFAKAISKTLDGGTASLYYEITFKGFSQKAEMAAAPDFGRQFAFEIAANNVLENGALNPEKVAEFLERYPPVFSTSLKNSLPKNAM